MGTYYEEARGGDGSLGGKGTSAHTTGLIWVGRRSGTKARERGSSLSSLPGSELVVSMDRGLRIFLKFTRGERNVKGGAGEHLRGTGPRAVSLGKQLRP